MRLSAAANISDIRRTVLVMKDGVLYKPEELRSALGVAPQLTPPYYNKATPKTGVMRSMVKLWM